MRIVLLLLLFYHYYYYYYYYYYGIYGTSSDTFLQMLKDLNFNQNLTHHIIMKASNIAIRCTYYIYCRRNNNNNNHHHH